MGCGWIGSALAVELIAKGYQVYGSTTSTNKVKQLEDKGITPFVIDINDKNINISEFLLSDILIIAITSKNISAFKNLIKKIEKSIFDKKWSLHGLHKLGYEGNQEGWEGKAKDRASTVGLGLRLRLRFSLGINMVVNMVPILAVFIILRSKGTWDILFVVKLEKCKN